MISRKFTYTIIALLTLGITGCSQDDDLTPSVDGKQELSIATRSTDGAGNTTATFTRPFVLELWAGNRKETFQMTYTEGSGWNTVKSSFSLPILVLAYCGEDVYSTSHDSYTVAVKVDQTDSDKLMAADVMVATGEAFPGVPLELNFRHIFAKVTFNATLASEFGEEDEITSLEVMTADEKTVNAYVDGETVTAIITPGAYTAGNDFLSITVSDADDPLTVKVPAVGLTFTAGTHYTFDLKVGKDKVTLTPVSTSTDFPGNWYDNDNYSDDVNLNN